MELNSLLTSGTTVLAASRRLAHALRIAYATHAQQQSWTAWRTPVILPWTTWLRQQWLEARARADAAAALRLLNPAQSRVLWEQIVVSHPLARELLNPTAAARIAQRSWRRLQDHLIPVERLLESDAEEAKALHAWAHEFMHRCASLHAIDEAQLTQWAHDVELTPTEPIALVGFDAYAPAVRRLVDRWAALGRIRSSAPPRRAEHITVKGLEDREAEVEAAARWARHHVAAGRREIAVIMADLAARHDEVRRRFEEVFAPAARGLTQVAAPPFIIAAPQPLAQFPIVDAALLCLQLVQGQCNSRLVGRLLRSPFLRGADAERDSRARADARLREEQRERWDAATLERWSAVTQCTQLELALREVTRLQRALPSRAAPSAWAAHFHALLRAFGWPGERTLNSVEQQTLVKLQATLAELGSLDAVTKNVSLAQALRELERLALDTPFEPETPAAAVTIIDPTTVAGMTFDAVWIAGLDAAQLPAAINPDPLIPLALQRQAGMPEASAETNFKHTRVRLERLLSSAAEIVLSWPRADGDAELQMSPLLSGLPQASVSAASTSDPSWQHAIFAARPALEVHVDDCAPALPERIARGGARTLELQSLCGFRAQATVRLRAEPLARVSAGLEPADRGKLLHRVLESIWLELGDQARLLALSPLVLQGRVHELAQLHAAQAIPATTRARAALSRLAVEHIAQQVLTLLAIDRQRPPFVVRRAERDESYTIAGLQLRLQPDRIDQLASGYLVVDYKLGAANEPRDWLDVWPGRPRKPQLPLYALAHAQELSGLTFAVLAPGAVEYRGWSNGTSIAPGIEPYPSGTRRAFDPPVDWSALLQRWAQSLNALATQYIRGEAAVDPLPDACTYCHLSTFCRIHERHESDEAETGAGDE